MERYSPRNLASSACGAFDNFRMEVRRKAKDVPIMLCVILLTSLFHIGGTVWSVPAGHMLYKAYFLGITPRLYCLNLEGLTPKQRIYCENTANREHMAAIVTGGKMAIDECEYQFRNSRWNCSFSPKDERNVLGQITARHLGNKEASFTYALSSAGVVWAISRACSEGNLSICGCNRKRCSDNTDHGEKVSTMFLDTYGEKQLSENSSNEEKARTLMNIHNNNVGRKLVSERRRRKCRCHGNTGQCNMKTCWREVLPFRKVGSSLRKKYKRAVRVKFHKDKKSGKEYLKRSNGSNRPFRNDLVFLVESPDYCIKSKKANIPGTVGRLCGNGNQDFCERLCCGRGYSTETTEATKKCKCKFEWCCKVECQECKTPIERKRCY